MNLLTDILPLQDWLPTDGNPLVIAGPCSAETQQQVMDTAIALAQQPHVKIFRAGLWKPRTRPGAFEGVEELGLEWLREVKAETGLLTTTEVANPYHVEKALKAGVDLLWLGARTVVNPFSIQEISDVLKGVDIPVVVKNPVNPDISLWLGALERIHNSGIRKMIAAHRGFFFFQQSVFRNAPMWEVPIELKRLCPNLPIVCDPSHIAGNRELLPSVAQKALDLEMDGLMVEVHTNPGQALTDAAQQITPQQLQNLLKDLVVRHVATNFKGDHFLDKIRTDIDVIDQELLHILSRRMDLIREIGRYKKANKITILQIKRWSELFADRLETGKKMALDEDFLTAVLHLIHKESIRMQTKVMNKNNNTPEKKQ